MGRTNGLSRISGLVITVLLPIVLMLTILQVYTFNKDFYLREFIKYDIPQVTKIGMEDLEDITQKMINYLRGKDENLDMVATIDGKPREVFGQREKDHMVDVKKLFIGGRLLRDRGFFLMAISLILLIRVSSNRVKDIYRSTLYAGILSMTMMIILFILMQIDFYKYFTYFHEIFFNNDLWILNPETEVLIQMLPLEFFIDISTRVIGWFMAIMVFLGSLSYKKLRVLK